MVAPVARRSLASRAVLAGLAVLWGCAETPLVPEPLPPTPAPVPSDADLLSLLPATAASILVVDVAALRDSVWAKDLLASAATLKSRGGPEARGFHEIKDAREWIIYRIHSEIRGEATLELAFARYDRKRVEQAFVATHGAARPTRFGLTEGMWDGTSAVVFPTRKTILFGPAWAVRLACRVVRGHDPPLRGERWLEQVAYALDGESGQWGKKPAVSLALRATDATRAELGRVLPEAAELEWLGGRLHLGAEANLTLVARAPDRGAASRLSKRVAEETEALAQRASVVSLGLGPVLEAATVRASGARTVLKARVSSEDRARVSERLAALAALLSKSTAGARP